MVSEAEDQKLDDKNDNQNKTTTLASRLIKTSDKLSLWHGRIALFDKVGRMPASRAFLLAAIICALLAAMANFQIRQSQFDIWKENKSFTYLDDTPLFSTTDASYFVGLAQEYKRSGDARIYTQKRLYPFYDEALKDEAPQTGMRDFPLLSVLIASLSPDSSTQSLLVTGNGLLPVLGFVLALGILLAFGASGFWLEGAVAAIGAGLAPTFLMRTSIGRIDGATAHHENKKRNW